MLLDPASDEVQLDRSGVGRTRFRRPRHASAHHRGRARDREHVGGAPVVRTRGDQGTEVGRQGAERRGGGDRGGVGAARRADARRSEARRRGCRSAPVPAGARSDGGLCPITSRYPRGWSSHAPRSGYLQGHASPLPPHRGAPHRRARAARPAGSERTGACRAVRSGPDEPRVQPPASVPRPDVERVQPRPGTGAHRDPGRAELHGRRPAARGAVGLHPARADVLVRARSHQGPGRDRRATSPSPISPRRRPRSWTSTGSRRPTAPP